MIKQLVTGQTTDQHKKKDILAYQKYDYITVVGASYMSFGEHIRDVAGMDARGNKMRFVNQGIRQIRLYPKPTEDFTIQRIFLIFIEDYPRNLLDKIKNVVESRYGAAYRELDNISQFVDFVNGRIQKKRFIRQLDIFSHGVVGSIEFGYALKKAGTYRFRNAQAKMLQQDAFEHDAKFYSYACRTGLGIDEGSYVKPGVDPCYEKSLAQIIADAADVEVWAFPKKSNFDMTYGTVEQRRIGNETVDKIRKYNDAMDQYRIDIRDYQARLSIYQKTKDSSAKRLPSEQPPSAPAKDFNEEDERLAKHELSRRENRRYFGYPLDEEGAVSPVRSGRDPAGLPPGLLQYLPRSWNEVKT